MEPMMNIFQSDEIIDLAQAAYQLAAESQFEADGRKDVGMCGGYMLRLDGRSKVTKRLQKRGLGGPYVCFHHGLPTQHRAVDIAGMRAAEEVFRKCGVRVAASWSYVD